MYRTEHARIIVGLERPPDSAQGLRVEEDDVAVVAADDECAAVGAERFVEQAVAPFVRHADRRRAAQERGEHAAARRSRVVEAYARGCEQEGAVEAWVGERLRSEALRVGDACLSPRLAPLLQRDHGGSDRQRQERES